MGSGMEGIATATLRKPTTDILMLAEVQYSSKQWLSLLAFYTRQATATG